MAKPKPPYPAGVQRAVNYALGCQAGTIDVAVPVVQAAARFLNDLDNAERGASLWEFRPDRAEEPILFAGWLPNIKGPLANMPLQLMDWQCFVYANVFGFYERGTNARRFRQAALFCPRGNGKTTFAAPIVLYMTFAEGEGGAEGYAAAVTRHQARILFDTAQDMMRRAVSLRSGLGVGLSVNALFQQTTSSRFAPISSDAKALDGLNVHVAVCDEIASHRTSEVYDVLLTAMAKRLHPLLLSISTATANKSGIGRQLWDYSLRVLSGAQQDDRLFALVYTIDEGDDPWAERSWIKANPSWGVSVMPDAIRAVMAQARNNPMQEAVAMTRHLNVWVGADEALFSLSVWRSRTNPALRLEDFEGQEAHMALDLASKTDLASVAITFATQDAAGANHYTTFSRSFLNEQAVAVARNASYPGWAAGGFLEVTPGNETDFSAIEEWILACAGRFRLLSVAYDPWAATQFAQRMTAENVPMIEFRATTQNFSEPTKELEAAIRGGRLQHDGDPVLAWAMSNVVGRYDARSNVYPRKSREENKIDPAVALIMTIGRCLASTETQSSYNSASTRSSIWVG